MAYSTIKEKRNCGGKLCVAGGPNLVSCANNHRMEGISMHLFPNEETDQQRQKKCINFLVANIDPGSKLLLPRVFVQRTSKIHAMM